MPEVNGEQQDTDGETVRIFSFIYVTCIMHSFAHSYFPSILIPLHANPNIYLQPHPLWKTLLPDWLLLQIHVHCGEMLRADWLVGDVLWQCGQLVVIATAQPLITLLENTLNFCNVESISENFWNNFSFKIQILKIQSVKFWKLKIISKS